MAEAEALEAREEESSRALIELLARDLDIERIIVIGARNHTLVREVCRRFSPKALWITDRSARRLIALADALEKEPLSTETIVHYSLVDFGGPLRKTQRQVERAKFPRGGFSLAIGHNEISHFEDLAIHFYFARLVLDRGGFYALHGPGTNHFPELFSILGLPPYSKGRTGTFTVDHIAHLAEAAGLEVIRRTCSGKSLSTTEAERVLLSTRETGIVRNLPRAPQRKEILRRYETAFGEEGSVRVTFDEWNLLLRTPGPAPKRSEPNKPV